MIAFVSRSHGCLSVLHSVQLTSGVQRTRLKFHVTYLDLVLWLFYFGIMKYRKFYFESIGHPSLYIEPLIIYGSILFRITLLNVDFQQEAEGFTFWWDQDGCSGPQSEALRVSSTTQTPTSVPTWWQIFIIIICQFFIRYQMHVPTRMTAKCKWQLLYCYWES